MIGYDTIARYVRLGIDKVKSVVYPNRDGSSIDQIIQQPFRVHSGASRGLLYAGAATAVILGLVYVVGCEREDGEVINPSTRPAGIEAPAEIGVGAQEPKKEDKRTKEELLDSLFSYFRERYGQYYEQMSRDDLAALVSEEDTGYYVVKFREPTKKEWIQEIERMGGHNYGGIPQNAALIRMDPSKKKEIEALPYVRWFGVFQPAYKLSIPLIGTYSSGGLNNPKENVNLRVFVFDDINLDNAKSTIEEFGGNVRKTYDYLTVTISETKVKDIATIPNVQWIEEVPVYKLLNK